MNAFILMLPFFAVRLALLPILSRGAARRAADSAPAFGNLEKFASNVYQLTGAAIFIYPYFMRAEFDGSWQCWTGSALCALGLSLLTAAVAAFARPGEAGLVTRGVYRLSRNPMNAAYAIYYLGVSALAKSPVLLSLAVVNSLAAHWVILSEERWCAEAFGEAWEAYSSKVRRYI